MSRRPPASISPLLLMLVTSVSFSDQTFGGELKSIEQLYLSAMKHKTLPTRNKINFPTVENWHNMHIEYYAHPTQHRRELHMLPTIKHAWDISPDEAIDLQTQLSKQVVKKDQLDVVTRIAGIDVAYHKNNETLIASIVIVDAHSLEIIESHAWAGMSSFPYIPGLFSFRELPSIIKLLSTIKHRPDLIICDGQGIAHPRRFGLASHLGVLFDIPTIGCGKSRFIGEYTPPDYKRGSQSSLFDDNEIIGAVLRTQENIKPVFVSIGHRVSLETACHWVLKAAPHYRLPETTRLADRYGRAFYEKIKDSINVPSQPLDH